MKAKLFSLIICVAFIMGSCTDGYKEGTEPDKDKEFALTPEEYASIAYDNPKEISEGEVISIVEDFQRINSELRKNIFINGSEVTNVGIKSKYYLTAQDGSHIIRSAQKTEKAIPIYEVEIERESREKDLILVCGDERAAKVLFYANNYAFSDKVNAGMGYLMEVARRSALSDIDLIEKLKTEKRNATLDKISKEFNIPVEEITEEFIKSQILISDGIDAKSFNNPVGGISNPSRIVAQFGPVSRIAWTEEYPYNTQMPQGLRTDGSAAYEGNYPVGCVNIAVATLFSILRPAMVGETASGRQILMDWDYVTSTPKLFIDKENPANSSPAKMVEMTGSLLRAIYNGTNSKPEYKTIDTYDEDENLVKKEVVVETSTRTTDMLNYIQTQATYLGGVKFDAGLAELSLQEHMPVLLYGNGYIRDNNNNPVAEGDYPKNMGHGWLIDGYCTTKKSGQVERDLYWSVNMGWGTNSSQVYFKAQSNFQDYEVSFPYDEEVNVVYYPQEQSMIYNIVKK